MVRLNRTAKGMYQATVNGKTYTVSQREGGTSGFKHYGWDVRAHGSFHKWFKTLSEVREFLNGLQEGY